MGTTNNTDFMPFDPRNGLDFRYVDINPETGNYELRGQGELSMRGDGELKILKPEEFEKLKLLMAPNVRWIIGRWSNMLSYRYHLEMEKEEEKRIETEGLNGVHKS